MNVFRTSRVHRVEFTKLEALLEITATVNNHMMDYLFYSVAEAGYYL